MQSLAGGREHLCPFLFPLSLLQHLSQEAGTAARGCRDSRAGVISSEMRSARHPAPEGPQNNASPHPRPHPPLLAGDPVSVASPSREQDGSFLLNRAQASSVWSHPPWPCLPMTGEGSLQPFTSALAGPYLQVWGLSVASCMPQVSESHLAGRLASHVYMCGCECVSEQGTGVLARELASVIT